MTALLVQCGKTPTRLGQLFLAAAAEAGEKSTTVVAANGPLGVLDLRHVLLNRPKATLVEVGAATALIPAMLKAARIEYSLAFERRPLRDPDALGFEVLKSGLRLAASSARAVLASDADVAEQAALTLDLPDVLSFAETIDLSFWPLAPRHEARRALGLVPEGRFVGLIADLSAPLRLDLLTTVHRRLPGIGLLVAGSGAEEPMIAAMAAATRPSSPVVHLGDRSPEHDLAVGLASDVILGLDQRGASAPNFGAIALGRRQAILAGPGVDRLAGYFPLARTIFSADAHPEALSAAIASAFAEEEAAGPLGAEEVAKARRALDATTMPRRLWKLVCASSS